MLAESRLRMLGVGHALWLAPLISFGSLAVPDHLFCFISGTGTERSLGPQAQNRAASLRPSNCPEAESPRADAARIWEFPTLI